MASSSPQLLYSIINHLHSLKGSSAIADSEPLDIALQCLNEATKINIDDQTTKDKLSVKYSLVDIFNAGLAALENPSAAPSSSSTSTPSVASSSTNSDAFDKFVSLLRTRGFFADCTTPEQEEARMKVAKEKFNQKYAADNAKSSPVEQTAAPAAAPKSVADVSDADKAAAEKAKNEGNAALNQGNYQEAITKYSEAIEKNPFSAIYFSNRAAAYINMAEYVKAESDCRSSIALDPNYPKSRYRLAQTFQARSKFAEAIPEYEKAFELAKDDVNMKATIREQLQTAKNNLNGGNNNRGTGGRGMGGGAAGGNPFGGMDFSSLLSNPAISQMMSNPQFMQMASQMMSGMGGGGAGGAGAGGMPDLSALANNPAVQQMMADPNMASIMDEVKSNPAAMSKYLNDPNIMSKLNSVMGGMGGNAPNNNDGPSSL